MVGLYGWVSSVVVVVLATSGVLSEKAAPSTFETIMGTVQNMMGSGTLGADYKVMAELWAKLNEFIAQGKHTQLVSEGPEVLLPVLARYIESTQGSYHHHCVQRTMCEANQRLVRSVNGPFGHFSAKLLSELIATALSRGDDIGYERAVYGSKIGRDGFNCTIKFPHCIHFKPLFEYTPVEDNEVL